MRHARLRLEITWSLSDVDSRGLDDKTCETLVRLNEQCADIAGGVHNGKDGLDLSVGAATKLGKKLTDVCERGFVVVARRWNDTGDHRAQAETRWFCRAAEVHTIVISSQHAELLKATRVKAYAGYSGPEMTAPSVEELHKLIAEKVIKATLPEV
jgi:S-adenosylmethionine synthetase